MRFARATSLLVCALTLIGCVPKNRAQPKIYTGPTEPMRDVVAAINENNANLPTLWSRGYFEANVVDQGRSHFVNGDVLVLYRRPGELRIVGKKDIAGTIFDIGSNAERYWLIVRGDVNTMWWGAHANADRVDPSEIPIPPQLMLEVLGVGAIDTNFRQPPAPVMRFNDDADVYMIVWSAPLADRWAAQKEVWYDRATKLPVKVLLFDADGRVVLRADLSKHVALRDAAGGAGNDAPEIASQYRLYFRASRTSITFNLESPALKSGNAPNDRSFAFPTEENAGVKRVVRVDDPSTNR